MASSLLAAVGEAAGSGQPFFSFEVFPPSTQQGLEALHRRLLQLAKHSPLFISVTCGASAADAARTLDVCSYILQYAGVEPLMHLTTAGKSKAELEALLDSAKTAGVRNVLALTGEAGEGQAPPTLKAVDLVRLIRERHGDAFCVAVGAYPEGWAPPGAGGDPPLVGRDLAPEVAALAEKAAAGAQLAVCQFSFAPQAWTALSAALAAAGVSLPLLPGLLASTTPALVRRMAAHCAVPLPALPAGSEPDAPSPALGDALAASAAALLAAGAPGVHWYTLNQVTALRAASSAPPVAAALAARGGLAGAGRKMPWRASAAPRREGEAVRPIFWANRAASYILRTASWETFPEGRWSDVGGGGLAPLAVGPDGAPAASGAGTPTSDGPGAALCSEAGGWGHPEARRAMWGETLASEAAVWEVFVKYLSGAVPRIPWCEAELHPETTPLRARLAALCGAGLLTINSQPQLCGTPSDHPVHGWGGPGGVVYQKAYVEFFARPAALAAVMAVAARPAFPSVRFMAVDARGHSYSNSKPGSATAVTWGVFPGREVVQPTVVDAGAFGVWREEAFALWRHVWVEAYPEDSPSHATLSDMAESYFLVNVVENDYVRGDVWAFLHAVLRELGGPGLEGVALPPTAQGPLPPGQGSLLEPGSGPGAGAGGVGGEAGAPAPPPAVVAAALGFDSPAAAASLGAPGSRAPPAGSNVK